MVDKYIGDILILIGTNDPAITFLKEDIEEDKQHREAILDVFKGSIWTLAREGIFLFQPSLSVSIHQDFYPIRGYYTLVRDLVKFQGQLPSTQGIYNFLKGTISIQADAIWLDVIYTVASVNPRIAHITQALSLQPYITVNELESPVPFMAEKNGTSYREHDGLG